MVESREAQLVIAVLARDVVGRIARALGEQGIDVMPLKGVLLHALVYHDPRERPMSDVDLLVRPQHLSRAEDLLVRRNYAKRGRGARGISVLLTDPATRIDVDLHAHLFPPGLFRLRTEDVFARATVSAAELGASVHVPDARDLYAHLVGHFVHGRHGAEDAVHLEDFRRTATVFGLDPATVAAHLEECGLGRAARYTLALARERGDEFAARVLAELRSDATGDAMAAGARRAMTRGRRSTAVWTHALNASLPRAAGSLALQTVDVLARRWRR